MSTKIYNGYQLKATTLRGLYAWKRKVQERFEAQAKKALSLEIAESAIQLVDTQVAASVLNWDILPPIVGPYMDHPAGIITTRLEESLKQSLYKNKRDDYQLSVTILFARGKTLALLHNDSRVTRNFFVKQPGVTPFPYWDNTDPDPYVSPKNWAEREEIWEEALYGSGVPANCGLIMETKDPTMYLWRREETPQFPNKVVRAKTVAKEYLYSIGAKHLDTNHMHQFFDLLGRVSRSHKRIDNIARIIYPHLPTITSWRQLAKYPLKTRPSDD